ncbi:uncharacterized protein PV09_05539 [Verruconis gallopava]|uniref:Zn(2)-C6 fungal-type domain-containing protein n=1 Tax=Verruconis gallopava TaxID=253628 RepID=A0A0D1YRS7_9PEZI|nr:uncharacterized protein PV09_05539 [Verruconis gallopava]KIW03327.1 hypothetical protein PV09_05539 [Verruconis gallopava]
MRFGQMPENDRVTRLLVPKPSTKEHLETNGSVNKGKKSRNGCLTCKARRMKCDETKPTCRQCARRGAACGGYPKIGFKWKHFIDPDIASRTQKTNISAQTAPQLGRRLGSFVTTGFQNDGSSTVSDCINEALECLSKEKSSPAKTGQLNLSSDEQSFGWQFEANDLAGTFDLDFLDMTHPINDVDLVGQELSDPLAFDITPLDQRMQNPRLDTSSFETLSAALGSNNTHFRAGPSSPTIGSAPLYRQPRFESDQIDIITTLFNNRTCVVLSVKDSCDENPWRTLIWPLAKNNPALQHAISAMACLQSGTERPELHIRGLAHVRQSIQSLREGLDTEAISVDAALATTLALSIAKSWEAPRTKTDFSHLTEAKMLLKQVVASVRDSQIPPNRARCLKFLANTWIYIDVTTRLTASEPIDSIDTELIEACGLLEDGSQRNKLDPLMGCASDLFPLLGRAADIVRQIWKDGWKRNSPPTIAQAAEVMRAVEKWTARINLTSSDDPAYIVQDAEQTAEAYRWAIFLLLRSAIPSLPGYMTYQQLAQKILIYLATIPISSGTVIVHMFPLLIAGCEVSAPEERAWVIERWEQMSKIMISGIAERCLELTLEAWRRKDGATESRHYNSDSLRIPGDPSEPLTAHANPDVDDLFDELVDAPNKVDEVDNATDPASPNDYAAVSLVPSTPVVHRPSSGKVADSWNSNALRSRLSWLAVMHDWKWQVMLG